MAAEGSTGPWIVGSLYLKKAGLALSPLAGPPVNGAAGTLFGKISVGGTIMDYTNGIEWQNVGTKTVPVWSPQGLVAVSLTSANLLAMFGTPVNVIAAPPAGYSVIVNNILMQMTRTATAYASGGVVTLSYSGGSVNVHSGSAPATILTTAGAAVTLLQLGPAVAANGSVVPTATGVDITNASGAFTTGTGTMKLYISYSVVKQ